MDGGGIVSKLVFEAISTSTVSGHLPRVYVKLHVSTNTGAVTKALGEKTR